MNPTSPIVHRRSSHIKRIKRANIDVPMLGDGRRRRVRPASRGLRKQEEMASGARKFFLVFMWLFIIVCASVLILSFAFD